jgi:uncharacterized protein YlxW (UPF0749 family)
VTISEIIALVSASVAALALIVNLLRVHKQDSSSSQAIRDKLDYISDTTRDVRQDVRQLDRKIDDQAQALVRIEEQVKDHERRLSNGGL